MPLSPGTRLGHYDVTSLLGEGGMGQVWQATDTQLGRQVALKILPDAFAADPDRLARFTREAQILASLNHPNIAAIHGIEEAEGTRALVLELVEGPTLADRISKGPIPLHEALPIAEEIAAALGAAHEAGVIHRDLKPANIKVRGDGAVKVLDFGLAKRVPVAEATPSDATTDLLTTVGMVVGTPAYMSPEQILGRAIDVRSDIFSFGVVLYESLTGTHPFRKDVASDTLAAILRDTPIPPSGGADPAMDALFGRLLAKAPAERSQTFEEVRAEIRRLADVMAGSGLDAGVPTISRRTPFVGRETERGELDRRVEETIRGRGGMVLIGGEPGVGKTRLVEQVLDTARQRRCLALTGRCYEMGGTPPFMPFVEILEESAVVVPRGALRAALGDAAPELARLMPDLRRLYPDVASPIPLPPQQQRHHLFKHYAEFLERASRVNPLVLLLDDLQWADDASLQLMQHLAPRLEQIRVLVLGTYRDVELDAQCPFARTLETLTRKRLAQPQKLEPFGQADVEVLLTALGGPSPPEQLVERLYRETEGNPFFVEEVFQHLQEEFALFEPDGRWHANLAVDELEVPEGVRSVINRRLERVSQESRRVLTACAIVGRSFSLELLEALDDMAGDALLAALEEAEGHHLIVPASKREARWEFSHALIRQTLAGGLSVPRRQRLHRRVGEAIERMTGETVETHVSDRAHHFYAETADAQPELLAHHFTEAGLNAKAVPYWQRAGQRALERSATLEAVAHLTQALELLATLPDTPERAQQELVVQAILGPALSAIKGYAAPEVFQAYTRARELCEQVGETPQRFQAVRGLWYFHLLRMELQTARELGEQLLTLAQDVGDPSLRLEAHYTLGNTLNYLGEFTDSQAHFDQGIALYDPQQHRDHAFRYGQDPGVACRAYAAMNLWWLGYPDQAVQMSHEALTLARQRSHPFSLIFALFFATWLHQFRQDGQLTQERAEACIDLATEQGFRLFQVGGTIFQGWALAERSAESGSGPRQREEGMAQMQRGLEDWQAIGAKVLRPYGLALLAKAHALAGQPALGLTLLDEGLAVTHNTEEHRWEAELYRLKGELLLCQSSDNSVEAETCFHQALAIARHQQAKSWELRTAISLSRLWQSQDKRQDVYDLLASVYAWFTEGFATADLREAKALLDDCWRSCESAEF